jgi:hypothetical protein
MRAPPLASATGASSSRRREPERSSPPRVGSRAFRGHLIRALFGERSRRAIAALDAGHRRADARRVRGLALLRVLLQRRHDRRVAEVLERVARDVVVAAGGCGIFSSPTDGVEQEV